MTHRRRHRCAAAALAVDDDAAPSAEPRVPDVSTKEPNSLSRPPRVKPRSDATAVLGERLFTLGVALVGGLRRVRREGAITCGV